MQSCASDHPTGHEVEATLPGPDLACLSGHRTIPASSIDRLGPEDLFAAGQTACHLGVVQLLDRLTRSC